MVAQSLFRVPVSFAGHDLTSRSLPLLIQRNVSYPSYFPSSSAPLSPPATTEHTLSSPAAADPCDDHEGRIFQLAQWAFRRRKPGRQSWGKAVGSGLRPQRGGA